MYVEDGQFYFYKLEGGAMAVTSKPDVEVADLEALIGVRVLVDTIGRERLWEYLRNYINARVSEKLDVNQATSSRLRKALTLRGQDRNPEYSGEPYIKQADIYFYQLPGNTMAATSHPTVPVTDLEALPGVRMIIDTGARDRLSHYFKTNINKEVADSLGITYATASRLRKALGLPDMGKGGDRKSHRYYREAYQDEPTPEATPEPA